MASISLVEGESDKHDTVDACAGAVIGILSGDTYFLSAMEVQSGMDLVKAILGQGRYTFTPEEAAEATGLRGQALNMMLQRLKRGNCPRPMAMRCVLCLAVTIWLLAGATAGIAADKDVLTLAESIEMAKRLSLQTDVDRQNIRERSFALQQARADRLPTVNVSSDYERLLQTHTLKNSLDVSWDISASAQNSVTSRALMLQAAEEQKAMSEALLVYQVKTGYYRLMLLRERLHVLRRGEEVLQKHRSKTERFVALGLRQRSALSRVDDRLATIGDEVTLVQGEIERARKGLLQRLNIPPGSGKTFAPCDKETPPLPELSRALAEALRNAPQLTRLDLERQSALEAVHSPWLDRLPTVSVGVGYQQEWPEPNDGMDVHIVLSIPIWDMGQARSKNDRNAALAAGMAAKTEQKRKEIADHIRLLCEDARISKALHAARKKSYAHRLETSKLMNAEYERGLLGETELIDTQKDIVDAAFAIEQAFYRCMTAIAGIDYYQGAVQ